MGFILILIGIALLLRPRHHFGCGLFGNSFYRRPLHHHDMFDHCGSMRGYQGFGGMHGSMGGHHGPEGMHGSMGGHHGPGGMHGPMF